MSELWFTYLRCNFGTKYNTLLQVKKLENHCEFLKRTVTELCLQLNDEKEKRSQMQQEIVKLTDLVTQV